MRKSYKCNYLITLKSFVLVCGLLISTNSFALQIKPIKDNGTVSASISNQGLTRIAIENDRILNVRGLSGAYGIKTDNQQGAVFIQPTEAYQNKPFTLFIATEQNHNYVLRLTPYNQNADTILLKPQGVSNPVAAQWEKSSPYAESISHLMTEMVSRHTPDGYSVNPVIKGKNYYIGAKAVIEPNFIYEGAYLEGRIYQITNRSSQTLQLTENQFYQSGDRAIALSSLIIMPHEKAWLYKVSSHG